MGIERAGITCETCGYMLLIDDITKIVFCQNCKKQIKPKYQQYIPK